MRSRRRRSLAVKLSLAGAVLVGSGLVMPLLAGGQRNYYIDRESCERDYSPSQCQAPRSAGGRWYGPSYGTGAGTDPGPGRAGTAAGVESLRGGFGGTGHGGG
jgi:hypothetical protein